MGALYPEREIVIEPDVEEEEEEVVRRPVIEEDDPSFKSSSWKKINQNAPSKQFLQFQAAVSKAPEQVIRSCFPHTRKSTQNTTQNTTQQHSTEYNNTTTFSTVIC